MASFKIEGGCELKGEITPQGAKNEALQVICATLLTDEKIVIKNIPNITDVNILIQLIGELGSAVKKIDAHTYSFEAKNIKMDTLHLPAFKKMSGKLRGSIMLAGPLLARFGEVFVARPGGDKIGRRKIDTHFLGFQMLGAEVNYDAEHIGYHLTAKKLQGAYILLDEPSVTGTANLIMAAALAEGTTTIFNAGCEPYIQQLCRMLTRMGAKINGIGSNFLTIEGVPTLKGTEHTLLSDFVEVGSFIGMAAMTQSAITIKNAQTKHLGIIPYVFEKVGIEIQMKDDDLIIPKQEIHTIESFMDGGIMTIADGPWPLFTPDLLSVILVVATQCKGTVLIHQKMFESRLFFVDKLIEMGAKIILCDPHRATVIGMERMNKLRGITMSSPDIRAGVALLIAALSAEGKSTINNIEQIDRGYENIDGRLNAMGANIKRLT